VSGEGKLRRATESHLPDIEQPEGSYGLSPRMTPDSGHQDLRGLYSMTLGMLRNSEAQFEGIQRILSEFLELTKTANEPREGARVLRQREQRRRAEIDLGLKVRFRSGSFSVSYERC